MAPDPSDPLFFPPDAPTEQRSASSALPPAPKATTEVRRLLSKVANADFALTGEPGRRRILAQPPEIAYPPDPGEQELALRPTTPTQPARESEATLSLLHTLQGRVLDLDRKLELQHQEIEILRQQLKHAEPAASAPGELAVVPSAAVAVSTSFDIELDIDPPKPETLGFGLDDLLRVVIKHQASDLHLKVNSPPIVRLHGDLIPIGEKILSQEECHYLILQAIPKGKRTRFLSIREVDHAHVSQGVRFRLNAFLERGRLSAAFRLVRADIPSFEQLGLPSVMTRFAGLHNGLVLVTGPAGCGKSTTLASLVDWINRNRKVHVVTVEDPIEYYHYDERSFITQREVGTDTTGFVEALRQTLRQDPNVILVGEMRDVETIMTAVTAAETGHLVLSTLHTPNAVQAIDRILDAFSGDQQKQIRMLLSSCLRGVVSQKLLTRADGTGRIPAVEVLVCTSTVSSFILDGNTKEIYPFIQQGAHEGMQTFTDSLRRLLERGLVTREEAMFHAEQLTELRLATRHVTGGAAAPGAIMNRL